MERPERAGAHRSAPERGGARLRPAEIRERISRLNRSAAWQALQPEAFRDSAGRRGCPPVAMLREAFRAAVAAGLVADEYGDKLGWLATVHDCSMNADSPGGRLAWRTAAGRLYWSGQAAFDWAKQVLRPPPPTDPIVVATAAACGLPARSRDSTPRETSRSVQPNDGDRS